MAAVDKIYGTKQQYDEFKLWCEKHKPEALDYFYEWKYTNDGLNHAMTNFPDHIDKWLLNNCPLDYIVNAIKHQYGFYVFGK